MAIELRKTGISIVGDVSWGTHFCHFYETKQDLLDTLVPYFKAGLENNEFCLWVVSDPLAREEARRALNEAVPDLNEHFLNENIEILDGQRWYLIEDLFNIERVTNAWDKKLEQALARGYDGMRVSGDTFWVREKDIKEFGAYERQLNDSITHRRMTLLCTYPLAKSRATEILDVVVAHQFAIARRQGEWEVIESPEPIQAKAEIKRLNEELQRVLDRTPTAPAIFRYLAAVLSVTAALIIARLLDFEMVTAPVSLFLCALMFSARYGGVRPGLLTMALSLLAFDYYFLTPIYSLNVETNEIPRFLIFAVASVFVVSLSAAQGKAAESLRRARDVLDTTVQELKRINVALQAENAERKRAEEALRGSEERFRQMAENIREVFWLSTADLSNTLYISPAYEGIWGRSRESLYREPRSFFAGIHSEDRPRVIAIIEKEREQGFEVEYRVVRPDGSMSWIRDRGFPIKDESGHFYRVAGIAEDITERKQAEEKLKQSESQLAEAQRVAHVGYWERNIDTGEITWSDETYRVFGLQPGGPIENFEELIHPEDRPLQAEATARTLRGEPYDVEYRVVRPDGEVRLVHSRGEVIRDDSVRPRRAFGTVQDVTELKGAEERLRAITEQLRALSAKLRSAREEESIRIAREIHDELGGTLTSLRWDLEGIDEVISEHPALSQRAGLRQRIAAMISLTDTTVDTVARIASDLRPMALDELGLIEAIQWHARQFQARSGIIVECDCVLKDVELNTEQSTAVFRVFQEALTNILRHAEATKVAVTIKQEEDRLGLTISDDGKGITEAEKSATQSLGILGMRERVRLIGGEIHIEGAEGQGTVIKVWVPIRFEPAGGGRPSL